MLQLLLLVLLIIPAAPLLLLAVWDGVDSNERQGQREVPIV